MKSFFALILIFSLIDFNCASAEAETEETSFRWQARPIEKWNVRAGIENHQVYLEIPESSTFGTSEIRYSPQTNQSFFVGAEKDQWGLNVSIDSLVNANKDKSYQDFRFYKYTDRWSLEGSLKKYKGFHASKSKDAQASTSTQRPDMSYEEISLGGMYNLFSENLSMPAMFLGSAKQEKSGGSIFITGTLAQTSLKSDLGLIPFAGDSQTCCQYKNDFTVQSLAIGALGAYNFVFAERWIAGLGWGFEIGSQQVTQSLASTASQSFANNRYLLNFGYQGDDFYALIYFLESTHQVTLTQIDSVRLGSMYSNFMVGYYF